MAEKFTKESFQAQFILGRSAAYLIDIALLFGVLMPLGFFLQRLLGLQAATGQEISVNILWNFSLPTWLYFTLSDSSKRGATLGKRFLGLKVTSKTTNDISLSRAVLRTAIKLLPWELVHISAFALSADLSQFSVLQFIGVGIANALWLTYSVVAVATKGRRSVHDLIVKTEVQATNA